MQKCQYYPPTTGTPDALRNSTKKEWKLVFSNFHFQILPKSGKTCFPISFSSHCIDICWNSAETKNNSNYTSQFIFPVFRIFLQKAFILLFILNYCIPTDINVMFQKKNTWNYTIYGWTIKRVAGEISSDLDRTKKMMENLNIIQISHLAFDCSCLMVSYDISINGPA